MVRPQNGAVLSPRAPAELVDEVLDEELDEDELVDELEVEELDDKLEVLCTRSGLIS